MSGDGKRRGKKATAGGAGGAGAAGTAGGAAAAAEAAAAAAAAGEPLAPPAVRDAVRAFGWLPDVPDVRDFDDAHSDVVKQFATVKAINPAAVAATALPAIKTLRTVYDNIPVENQGRIGSCTAQAGIGVLEYYVFVRHGRLEDFSRLFLYKATRELMGWQGDTGAYLRTTVQALVTIGAPPERHWPYVEALYDDVPPTFCYAVAQNFQTLKYAKLDKRRSDDTLQSVKRYLAANHPVMFGFTVYSSIGAARHTGDIPYPRRGDRVEGGHAVVAIGYDDQRRVLLIRNSWGAGWGNGGYGTLPYAYVENGLARDFWCLLASEYLDTDVFK